MTATSIVTLGPATIAMPNPWHRDGLPTIFDLEVSLVVYIATPPRSFFVAWAWERADNPGVSITNAAEHVYCKLRDLIGADAPAPWFALECYGPRSYAGVVALGERETFDLVTLGDDAEPSWHRLGTSRQEALEALVAIVGAR